MCIRDRIPVEPEGVREIARRSRGTPRIVNRLLKRVRDFAQVRADGVITYEVAREDVYKRQGGWPRRRRIQTSGKTP